MANNKSQKGEKSSRQRKDSLQKLKMETANELGIDLKEGYNGDISSKDAGRIGGGMTRKVIETVENEKTR